VTLPHGYTLLTRGPVRAAVRTELADVLGPWLLASPLARPADAAAMAGGRGGTYRAVLPGGLRAVVRPYRRGGWLARVVHDTYVGWRARPLRELAATVEASRRGVAVADVLAARVEGGVVYRGALVTAEVPDTTPLIDALRAAPDAAARAALAASAGAAVGRMHVAGIAHADLNLTNLLARAGAVVAIVDFDRAAVMPRPLGQAARRRNLRRLARSLRKLDPGGTVHDATVVAAFRVSYGATGLPCAC
jgi:3-deoxy-D-manno-octulosonic acid kinase